MNFNFKEIHIGQLIYNIVNYKNIEESRIKNFFNNQDLDLNEVYKLKDVNTEDLLKWSKLLRYDLFRIYSQHLMLYANIESLTEKVVVNDQIPIFKKSIYTKEVILFICELIKNKEKTFDQVLKEYNIPKTTLYRWLKKYNL